eukprot:6488223-Amphidinium_carterae.1
MAFSLEHHNAMVVPDLPEFHWEDLFACSVDKPSFSASRTADPPLVADPDVPGPKRRRLEKPFSGWVGEDANAKDKEVVLWLELLVGIADQSRVGQQLAAMRESGATATELVQFLGILTADKASITLAKHRMYLSFLLSSGFPIIVDETQAFAYMKSLLDAGSRHSRATGVLKALRFLQHIFEVPDLKQ